jgi:DNA-binding GntR family transcriptional regulator
VSAAPHGAAVETLAQALRDLILDGELTGHLVEQELCAAHGVARHTARAALRALAAEGLVAIEPNRGARVAQLGPDDVRGLYALRTAIEVEGVRLALERGPFPPQVAQAVERHSRACRARRPAWSTVVVAHDELHRALVAASGSPRLTAAHAALAAETRLFLVQLRPAFTLEELATDHERLPAELERHGPDALRAHLGASARALLALLA